MGQAPPPEEGPELEGNPELAASSEESNRDLTGCPDLSVQSTLIAQALWAMLDIPFLLMALVILGTLWRAKPVFQYARSVIRQDDAADKIRGNVCKHFFALFLDILIVGMAILLLPCCWRWGTLYRIVRPRPREAAAVEEEREANRPPEPELIVLIYESLPRVLVLAIADIITVPFIFLNLAIATFALECYKCQVRF